MSSAPEPWLNRVVAFRSHQVRPSNKPPRRLGDDHNSDTSPQPKEAIGSEKLSPVVHSREQESFRTTFPFLQSLRRVAIRCQTVVVWPGRRRIATRRSDCKTGKVVLKDSCSLLCTT